MNNGGEVVFWGFLCIIGSYFFYKSWKIKGLQIHLMYASSSLIFGIVFVIMGLWKLFSKQ